MRLILAPEVIDRFPDLRIDTGVVASVKVVKEDPDLRRLIAGELVEIRRKYSVSNIREIPILKAYRYLLMQTIGKDESSVEALFRRVLKGRPFPSINNVVDACNLAVLKSLTAMGVFDVDRISGDATIRFAEKGEKFLEIGKSAHVELNGGEMVISDAKKIFSIPIHRDADETKITKRTKNVLLIVLGTKNEELSIIAHKAIELISCFCARVNE